VGGTGGGESEKPSLEKVKGFFCAPKYPDRKWDPQSLLYDWYRELFARE
jgi:hypothetical protein